MTEDSPRETGSSGETPEDRTYGELLGEYFSVANELASLLDEHGRPAPGADEKHARLRAEKDALRRELAQAGAEEQDDIKQTLEDAFES